MSIGAAGNEQIDWLGLIQELGSESGVLLFLSSSGLPAQEWEAIVNVLRKRESELCSRQSRIFALCTGGRSLNGEFHGVPNFLINNRKKLFAHFVAACPGSAILIEDLECLVDTPVSTGATEGKIWSGAVFRQQTDVEVYGQGLADIIKLILQWADQQSVIVIATARVNPETYERFFRSQKWRGNFYVVQATSELDRTTMELARIAGQVRDGSCSIPEACAWVEKQDIAEEQKALCRSHIHTAAGLFRKAWEDIQSFLDSYPDESAGFSLTVAQTALAAFELSVARQWLLKAIEQGFRTPGEIHSARVVAIGLEDVGLAAQLSQQLTTRFPESSVMLLERMRAAVDKGEYGQAGEYAQRLGFSFETKIYNELKTGPSLVDLPSAFADPEDQARARSVMAEEAFRRGDLTDALLISQEIGPTSKSFEAAISIRLGVLRRSILHAGAVEDDDVVQFVNLLKDSAATLPNLPRARMELFALFESHLADRLALELLVLTLDKLGAAVLEKAKNAPTASVVAENGSVTPLEELMKFFKEWIDENGSTPVFLGRAFIPSVITKSGTSDHVRRILQLAQDTSFANDRSLSMMFAAVAEQICRAIGEPSKDFLTIIQFIHTKGRSSNFQDARDLAEEALFGLSETQECHRPWRAGLAWWAYGESYAIARNWNAALIGANLASACWTKEVVDAESIIHYLRFLARVFRELRLADLARGTLESERSLRVSHGVTDLLWQLDGTLLSIEASELSGNDTAGWSDLLVRSELCLQSVPSWVERLPIVSIMVNAVRRLRANGASLDDSVIGRLSSILAEDPTNAARLFETLLTPPVTREQFAAEIVKLGVVIRENDLGGQLMPLHGLAEEMVSKASGLRDGDLFLLAANTICQPSTRYKTSAENRRPDPGKLRRFIRTLIAADPDVDQKADLVELMQQCGEDRLLDISRLIIPDVERVRSLLKADECLCVVCLGIEDEVRACCIGKIGLARILTFTGQMYRRARMISMIAEFVVENRSRRGAGGWNAADLANFFADAEWQALDPAARHLTIVPCPELFAFPFPLLQYRSPTVPWWCETRSSVDSGRSFQVAWLGDQNSFDQTLKDARRIFYPIFEAKKIVVETGSRLTRSANAALAIIVAHGLSSEGGDFLSLSDGLTAYSPSEIAGWVGGTKCVVLCVCSGGHSTMGSVRSETQGLVAALLQNGVRCVIGSRWALDVEYAAKWVETFLDALLNGVPAGVAAHAASSIRSTDAAEWAAMQVFGDSSTTV